MGNWPCAVAHMIESTLHLMMRPGYILQGDLRFLARLDLAHFVLAEDRHDPLLVLDERHGRRHRQRHGHRAGTQRQRYHGAVGRRVVDGLVETPFGIGQLRLGARDLRLDVRDLVLLAAGGLGGELLPDLRFAGDADVELRLRDSRHRSAPVRSRTGCRRRSAASSLQLLLAHPGQLQLRRDRVAGCRCALRSCCAEAALARVGRDQLHIELLRAAPCSPSTSISYGRRIDLEQHVALLDRAVRLDRHLGDAAR